MRRVAITGAGTINPLGHSVGETFTAMQDGRTPIGQLDIPDLNRLTIRIGAQVKGYRAEDHFDARQIALFDRATQFAMHAAAEAVAAAGLDLTAFDPARAGVIMGTAAGGLETSEENYRAVFEAGKSRVPPLTVPRLMANAAASQISIAHGLRGPVYTVSTACASSNHAIGQAFHLIRAGAADMMLAGGADATLTFGGIKAWEGLRVLSPDGCRPFCATRNGMVQGEGAAVFVLEDYASAKARGAPILAEIAGFAMRADAGDIVMPDPETARETMAQALADGGLSPNDIGYINAHGTGTSANDRVESGAIAALFGAGAAGPAVSSTKSLHGHLMGAAGAVELLAVILALKEGAIAPTAGHRETDSGCPINLVANHAAKRAVDAALSNAFAFGGLNAVLALKRA